jgi:hypothetical protein
MVMAAFLLAGCDKTEEGKAALSIGTKATAPKSEEQEYVEAYKDYLTSESERAKKAADCDTQMMQFDNKQLRGEAFTASDMARMKELNTGACKAATDAGYEKRHAATKVPQITYRPTRGAEATGQGAISMREQIKK